DVFHFQQRDTTITDFSVGEDKLVIAWDFTGGFDQWIQRVNQVGNDVVFTNGDHRLTLKNVQKSELSAKDVLFWITTTPPSEESDYIWAPYPDTIISAGGGNDVIYGVNIEGGAGNDELIVAWGHTGRLS